jgi:hypothetical protein
MLKKILLLVAFMALSPNLAWASIESNISTHSIPASSTTLGHASPLSENATHSANIKNAQSAYQNAIKTAKAVLNQATQTAKAGPKANRSTILKNAQATYKRSILSAKNILNLAIAAENTRHKQAVAASKTSASSTIKAKPVAVQTTGTITVVVQDGNGKPFGHPADYDIHVGSNPDTLAYGPLTADSTQTNALVGMYTIVARDVTVDGVTYTTRVSQLSPSNAIAKQDDQVSFRLDYLAPAKQVTFVMDQPATVTISGPNGWSSGPITDTNPHSFDNVLSGIYTLQVGLPTLTDANGLSLFDDFYVTTQSEISSQSWTMDCFYYAGDVGPEGTLSFHVDFVKDFDVRRPCATTKKKK